MEYNEQKQERVILAGVHRGMRDALWDTTEESIHELGELVKTAGGIVVGEMIQNKADLESATYMGEGKLDELKIAIETLNADMVVFDDELSPVQMRNISDFLEIKVLDRSMLILDIFAMRAKSGEGKLQVELAQLKYRLPRLRGFGVEMSRTGAGIGTRGPGETRLESDRRHIRRRISALEEEIKELINNGKATFYIGFDPTADSLHVGHFMALCLMKRLQMAGNRPIALIGGGTAMIGDPSGRTDMRQMMTPETIQHNVTVSRNRCPVSLTFQTAKH